MAKSNGTTAPSLASENATREFRLQDCLRFDPRISSLGCEILCEILKWVNEETGRTIPLPDEIIAVGIGRPWRSIQREREKLREAGYLSWTRKGIGERNTYRINFEQVERILEARKAALAAKWKELKVRHPRHNAPVRDDAMAITQECAMAITHPCAILTPYGSTPFKEENSLTGKERVRETPEIRTGKHREGENGLEGKPANLRLSSPKPATKPPKPRGSALVTHQLGDGGPIQAATASTDIARNLPRTPVTALDIHVANCLAGRGPPMRGGKTLTPEHRAKLRWKPERYVRHSAIMARRREEKLQAKIEMEEQPG